MATHANWTKPPWSLRVFLQHPQLLQPYHTDWSVHASFGSSIVSKSRALVIARDLKGASPIGLIRQEISKEHGKSNQRR